MSAGTGIRHSEFNASTTEPVHFLQIWILPERPGLTPRYDQVAFPEAELRNRLRLIASPDGAEGSVRLFQDVKIQAARLEAGSEVQPGLLPGRSGFLQVARGSVVLNGHALNAGDGARIQGEASIKVMAASPTEFLFFDLA
jgi:redox-sensitive bicupin YhaK (pirin superfamily)